jgi:tyrosinase
MQSKVQSMKHMTFEHNVDRTIEPMADIITNLAFIQRLNSNVVASLMSRPRRNQKSLSEDDKKDFNRAIKTAVEDGMYQKIAEIHHDMGHLMHSMSGYWGILRFLPWHRVFVYKMEVLLGNYVPGIRIPYWDWANDRDLPSWIYSPPGVTRGPDKKFTLPTETGVSTILDKTTYLEFTTGLEGAHNTVHMWAGGTMQNLMYSSDDPIFWLHHSNVDRIWHRWQHTHKELPPLSAAKAVMDPWPDTVNDTEFAFNYQYYYKPP